MKHPLASLTGIEAIFGILMHRGQMCPKCGYATRNTSKRWARCKRCNERVERRELPAPKPTPTTA